MSNVSISDAELLKFVIESGMLDTALVQEKIEMQKREEILKKHPYKIYQGQDGKWYTYLPDGDNERKKVKLSSKESIENRVIEFWKEKEYNPTLEEVFEEYNNSRLELKQISAASHLRYKQEFARYYTDWKRRKIRQISADELCEHLEMQIAKLELTSKAFSNLKTITKGIFKRAYRKKIVDFRVVEEVIDVIDTSGTRFKKVHKEDFQEVFSEEEYPEYLKYLSENADLWNIGILLILVTGIRGGELVSLTYDDIEKHEDFFTINVRSTETRYKDSNGKYVYEVKEAPKSEAGYRHAVVPKQYLWIYNELHRLGTGQGYVFVNQKTGKRFTTNSIRRREERNCKRLGYYHKSPHKARKTYGSILLDNNVDENMVLGQMGHVDISTTEKHYHRNMKNIEKKASIISQIPIFDAKIV